MKISKKQLLLDRQALLDEIAALQKENLILRIGEPPPLPVPASPDEEAVARQSDFSRFPKLRAVDEQYENVNPDDSAADIKTLPQAAEHLRRYAAAHFGLYASRALYASFLGAMAASDFIILRSEDDGRSALTLSRAAAAAWGQDIDIISMQPEWSRTADLLGELDPATKYYRETDFLRSVYEAAYRDGASFTVLDNISASAERCLTELLPLLSLSHNQVNLARMIPLSETAWPGDPALLQNGALPWPGNLWLFGTLPDDRTQLSPQLRSAAMEFCLPSQKQAKSFLTPLQKTAVVPARQLRSLFAHAREVFVLPEETLRLYTQVERYLADHMELSLGAQTQSQLKCFSSVCLACGLRPAEALDSFFYQKALRRLEYIEPGILKYELPGLRRFITEAFGKRAVPLTLSLLESMQETGSVG